MTEESGIEFQALNDSSNLYLQIVSDDDDARALLSGKYRQDFTIWFLDPDGKKRAWGARVPFSQMSASGDNASAVELEMVSMMGIDVSTSPLPDGVQIKAALSGKELMYGLQVPLAMLQPASNGKVPFDFVSSPVSEDIQRRSARPQSTSGGQDAGGAGSGGTSGRAGHGGKGGGKGGSGHNTPGETTPPGPLNLKLTLHLAARLTQNE